AHKMTNQTMGLLESATSPIRIDSGLLRKGALPRLLIFSQTKKHWRAQLHSAIGGFMRPFRKFDLRHSLRFQPVHVSRVHFAVKRTAIGFPLLEQLPDLFEHCLIESCSRLSHVN